jgi:hypothetical protein
MTMEPEITFQETVNRLTSKLQAFMDGLPEDEERALGLILQQACTENAGDVSGYAIPPAQLAAAGLTGQGIILVGIHGGWDFTLTPGASRGIIIIGGRGQ